MIYDVNTHEYDCNSGTTYDDRNEKYLVAEMLDNYFGDSIITVNDRYNIFDLTINYKGKIYDCDVKASSYLHSNTKAIPVGYNAGQRQKYIESPNEVRILFLFVDLLSVYNVKADDWIDEYFIKDKVNDRTKGILYNVKFAQLNNNKPILKLKRNDKKNSIYHS
jgi:hypothetical protein